MYTKYFAHSKDGKTFIDATSENESQELKDHLHKTAMHAKKKAGAFGAECLGEVIGLLHDVGKYSDDFQKKIRGETKKSVKHAIAGAYALKNEYGREGELYGIAIASHHLGLMDFGTTKDTDNSKYYGKLNEYESNKGNEALIYKMEINLPEKIASGIQFCNDKNTLAFQAATLVRMLFSVLVDSDFTDTEEFCTKIIRTPSKINFVDALENLLGNMPQKSESKISTIRASILKDCLHSAQAAQGLFTLTVPTGGGKTLSSLAFAIKHAAKHNLRRIIYVIPYTSIIEQNAEVIRSKLGDGIVLEHHSGVFDENGDSDIKMRWASENWDIPVIVTTNVQFFESLFANKTTKARKIHNIAKSVIIFDEAQMLPREYISPCSYIISELVANYGVTAVLCSATQPVLNKYMYKDIQAVEIAYNPESLAEELKRVRFRYVGKKTDDEIIGELCGIGSSLTVVNTRKHAFTLYQKALCFISGDSLFYLSTLLTPKHRTKKINHIKERLKNNLPVTVISTQLIEAGVDIDFPVVYRSITGIDSIIQAGGRANRENKLQNPDGSLMLGEVIVFEPCGDNNVIPESLKAAASIGKEIIEVLGDSAFDLSGIKKYFGMLYANLERDGKIDKNEILQEFEILNRYVKMNFETASDKFKIIEDNTYGIVIPCDESKKTIDNIRKGNYDRDAIRKLQGYTVSVYPHEFNALKNDNAIEADIGGVKGINVLVTGKYYSEETGLDLFTDTNKNAEAFIL